VGIGCVHDVEDFAFSTADPSDRFVLAVVQDTVIFLIIGASNKYSRLENEHSFVAH
jgi:hypothetical protein